MTDEKGIAENPLAFGNVAYLPSMPVGTQSYATPAPIATVNGGKTPADGNAGVDVNVGYEETVSLRGQPERPVQNPTPFPFYTLRRFRSLRQAQ